MLIERDHHDDNDGERAIAAIAFVALVPAMGGQMRTSPDVSGRMIGGRLHVEPDEPATASDR